MIQSMAAELREIYNDDEIDSQALDFHVSAVVERHVSDAKGLRAWCRAAADAWRSGGHALTSAVVQCMLDVKRVMGRDDDGWDDRFRSALARGGMHDALVRFLQHLGERGRPAGEQQSLVFRSSHEMGDLRVMIMLLGMRDVATVAAMLQGTASRPDCERSHAFDVVDGTSSRYQLAPETAYRGTEGALLRFVDACHVWRGCCRRGRGAPASVDMACTGGIVYMPSLMETMRELDDARARYVTRRVRLHALVRDSRELPPPLPQAGSVPCAAAACSNPATHACDACIGAMYCSTECQRADWHAWHVAECRTAEWRDSMDADT